MTNRWFGAMMTSSNSSTWRCSNRSDERRGSMERRKERRKKRKGKKKRLEKKGEGPVTEPSQRQGTKEEKLHPLFLFRQPTKIRNWELDSFLSFSSLTFPKSPCSWHGLLGLPVCSWLPCLPLTNLGHHPSVLPQPSSSNNFL